MDEPIISLDMIRAKARAAFNRGAGRDDHNFNWHSTAAIAAWQGEWDWCVQAWRADTQPWPQVVKVSPP